MNWIAWDMEGNAFGRESMIPDINLRDERAVPIRLNGKEPQLGSYSSPPSSLYPYPSPLPITLLPLTLNDINDNEALDIC